jgi:hypothetical protein
MANSPICSIRSAMQMVLQACPLNQPNDMPVATNKTKKDKIFYLTGNKLAKLLRKAVKAVRPDTSKKDDLKKLLCSFVTRLSMCFVRQSREVPRIHQKEALLVR